MSVLPGPPVPAASHPPPEMLHVYGSSGLDPSSSVSVELHLETCEQCRSTVNAAASSATRARLDASWFMIAAELDAPKRGFFERAATRLGLPSDVARLMAATPSLRRSWFIAVVAALVVGMAASNPDRPGGSLVLFLALAPLVPVLGVALAYGPGVDPAHEITVSAPLSGFRLVLLRTAAVLATSVVVGGLASMLLVERQGAVAVAWLLPGLSLSLVCLALTTYLAPKTAAWVVSVPWLLVVLMVGERAADPLILFRPPGQALLAVVGLAATAVVIARRRRFDLAAVSS